MERSTHLPHYSQAGRLLLLWQYIQDKLLIHCPFGKPEQQCSWSSMSWNHFPTSCVVVVETVAAIKILKWICNFEQTEIIYCIICICKAFSKTAAKAVALENLQCFVARVEKICRVINCYTLLRLLPLRLSSCTVHQAMFKVLKTSMAFIKLKWMLLFHF